MNPFSSFEEWYKEELYKTSVSIPSACCLSTIGLDGYPNARFVSFKFLIDGCFVITGPTISRKGLEMNAEPKAALTFWWTETERQVRIQGDVLPLEKALADKYFKERDKDAQIISHIFTQGEEMTNYSDQFHAYNEARKLHHDSMVLRPEGWGGFKIKPIRIEFLDFEQNRFHTRTLYIKKGAEWESILIQP